LYNFYRNLNFDLFSYPSWENTPFNNTKLLYRGNFDMFKTGEVIKSISLGWIYGPPKGFPFLESGQNSIFPPNNRKEPTSAPSVGIPDTKWSSSLLYVVVVAGPCTNQTEASISRGSHGSGPFRKRLCNTKSPKSLPQHLVIVDGDPCGYSSLPCMHAYNNIASGLLYGLRKVMLFSSY
jgi:hypothetical protein